MLVHLQGRKNENFPVHYAFQKYDDWKISVLHTCYSRDDANRIEIEEIRNFNSVAPNGYNLTSGGGGGDTFTNNPNKAEILLNMSRASKGRCPSDKTKQKMRDAAIGRVMSEDQKEKLRQANLGKKQSVETKQKLKKWRETHVPPMLGKKLTPESKAKVFATKRANTVAKTVGKTFGRLRVIEYLPEILGNRDWYRCICVCGQEENIQGSNLRRRAFCKCKCELIKDAEPSNMKVAQIKRRYREYKQKIRELEDAK